MCFTKNLNQTTNLKLMSLRPFIDIKRKKTRVISVGKIKIGGDNPIPVKSMTNTKTTDIKSTINATKKIFKKIDQKCVNINSSQEDQILKKITIN